MLITKSKFLEILDTPHYGAISKVYDLIIKGNNEDVEKLINEEQRENMRKAVGALFEDNEDSDKAKHEAMKKYYDEVELETMINLRKVFGENISLNLNSNEQKILKYDAGDDLILITSLNNYQEKDGNLRIVETKYTTTKKLESLIIKNEHKEEIPIFLDLNTKETKEPILIYTGYEKYGEIGLDVDGCEGKYEKKVESITKRKHDVGKFLYELAFKKYILDRSELKYKDVKYYLSLINAKYKKGFLEKSNPTMRIVDVTKLLPLFENQIEEDIKKVKFHLSQNEITDEIKKGTLPKKMMSESVYCEMVTKKVPEVGSVYDFIQKHLLDVDNLFDKYEMMVNVPDNLLRPVNKIQKEVLITGVPYVNTKKILLGLKQLKFPIYHLDFETLPIPLPRFNGEKPYEQSLFQYSIHIERTEGNCDKEKDSRFFLASTPNDDERRLFVEKMLKDIKDDGGSVVVWNKTFESGRLKELKIHFPEYSERLEEIESRLFDLMDLLKGNANLYKEINDGTLSEEEISQINYYHQDLKGSYSIKRVLPIFTELSYDDLDVKNGNEAIVRFAEMANLTGESLKKAQNELLEYCGQDTWAMVEILRGLRKLVKK